MTQEASTNQQYINLSMFRVSVPRRARARRVDQALVQGLFAKTKVFMAYCNLLRVQ